MSFQFNWPEFSEELKQSLALQIEEAINEAAIPSTIIGKIAVTVFEPGTKAPELEFLEISELNLETARATLRLAYDGDARMTIQLQVQANPLHFLTGQDDLVPGRVVAAGDSFIVPMELTISKLRLNTIIVLNVNRLQGVTVTFRNDPLECMEVSSSFDGIAKGFIQEELERRVREALRTTVPQIVHEQTKKLFEEARRTSISEVPGRSSRRRSSATSNGPIRIRTGPRPTSPTILDSIPESPHTHSDIFETASQISCTSRFSTTSSRFPSMVRSRFGSVVGHHQIPMAKRLEILRTQHSSLSPVGLYQGSVVHKVSMMSLSQEQTPNLDPDTDP